MTRPDRTDPSGNDPSRTELLGAVVGSAVGDAWGAPFEFDAGAVYGIDAAPGR